MRSTAWVGPVAGAIALGLVALVLSVGGKPSVEREPQTYLLAPTWLPRNMVVHRLSIYGGGARPLIRQPCVRPAWFASGIWGRLSDRGLAAASIFATVSEHAIRDQFVDLSVHGYRRTTVQGHPAVVGETYLDPSQLSEVQVRDDRFVWDLLGYRTSRGELLQVARGLAPHLGCPDGSIDAAYVPRAFTKLDAPTDLDYLGGTRIILDTATLAPDRHTSYYLEIDVGGSESLWRWAWSAEKGFWTTVRGHRALVVLPRYRGGATRVVWNEGPHVQANLTSANADASEMALFANNLRPLTREDWTALAYQAHDTFEQSPPIVPHDWSVPCVTPRCVRS